MTGGDVLIAHAAADQYRLPIGGFLPVATNALRVAGFASTVPGVDMVVSLATGRLLGMTPVNGAVISVEPLVQMAG